MTDAVPSQSQANLRLPIEVHERVIDAIFDDRYSLVLDALAMLSSCALVCRAWRPRAQRILFEYVLLRDKDALFRLAELIDASPELGTYVRKLALRGYLHVPYSLVVLFLTALRGKLPNLSVLNIQGFDDEERAANPPPEAQKELPTLPIHRYFPSLVKSISHIHSLSLVAVKFPSFGDFARFLDALPNLTDLFCLRVSWAVLGQEPACMAKRNPHDSRKTFLPNLKKLAYFAIDGEGRQRLLSALSPSESLIRLDITFPSVPPAQVRVENSDLEQKAPSLALDLRPFPCIERVYCLLAPFPQPHDQTLQAVQESLLSWVPEGGKKIGDGPPIERLLYLRPWGRDLFKREGYVALLRAIGPVVEAALCRRESPKGGLGNPTGGDTDAHTETYPCKAELVVLDLGDKLEWEDWWRAVMTECFPTLSRWNKVDLCTSHATDPTARWQDQDSTPQDYADRMRTIAEARRRLKQMNRFVATRGVLVRRRWKWKRNEAGRL